MVITITSSPPKYYGMVAAIVANLSDGMLMEPV